MSGMPAVRPQVGRQPSRRRLASSLLLPLLASLGLAACGDETPVEPAVERVEATAAAASSYVVVPLGTLGGDRSEANDINQAGVVVGWSWTEPGRFNQRPFRWKAGVMTDLGTLGGLYGEAKAINGDGVIVGWSYSKSGNQRATRWLNGALKNLGTLGGLTSEALDINDAGVIVGWAQTASGEKHPFLWKDRKMIDLGTLGGSFGIAQAINRSGVVVGWASTPSGRNHAFRWKDGVMKDLGDMGRLSTFAFGINNQGQIVGGVGALPDAVGDELEMGDAFTLIKGTPSIFHQGGYISAQAEDVNAGGAIVGTSDDYTDDAERSNAFVFENGVGTILDELTAPASSLLAAAHAINVGGDVVGWQGPVGGNTRAILWRRR